MNYLAICQRVVQEAGITGQGPTTVENQSGQLAKVTGWVAQAWVDVQLMRPNWNFMHESGSFFTLSGTRDYVFADKGIIDLKLLDTGSVVMTEVSGEDGFLNYLPYSEWRAKYRIGMNARLQDKPVYFTLLPANDIRFEPAPDGLYLINFEYKRSSQNFTANTDVPTNLPDDFHLIIVWAALKYYASYENAPEIMDEAEMNFANLLHRLEIEQLAEFSEDYHSLA